MLKKLDFTEQQANYLNNYGHMSALDPCFGLYVAEQQNLLNRGDIVVLASAGTGYTWGATVLEWC